MAEFDTKGFATHPIGWSFLGAGAALWLAPFLGGGTVELWFRRFDVAGQLLIALFAATLVGLLVEFAMIPVETGLLRVTKLGDDNPTSKEWSAAWQRRWASSVADSEFRRYEGIASVARAYAVHSLLAGLAWLIALHDITGALLLLAGLCSTALFVGMWYFNTTKIFLVVRAASSWSASSGP